MENIVYCFVLNVLGENEVFLGEIHLILGEIEFLLFSGSNYLFFLNENELLFSAFLTKVTHFRPKSFSEM